MYIQQLTDYEKDSGQYADWKEFVYACKHYNQFFDLSVMDYEKNDCEGSTTKTETNHAKKAAPDKEHISFHSRGELLEGLYENCLRHLEVEISVGSRFYRARVINKDVYELNVGPAPRNKANEGRMNPRGKSYFYVAEDKDTPLAEIRATNGDHVLIGEFKTKKTLNVIDWTYPTIAKRLYDIFEEEYNPHAAIYRDFLSCFANEVTKIQNEKDNKLMYIPTQLIAEYVRMCGYDGIRYGSSVGRGDNIVLFYGPKREDDIDENWEITPEYTDIVDLVELKDINLEVGEL